MAFAFIIFGSFAQHQVNKNFPNVTSIDVDGFFCDVTIKPSTGNNVEFSGSINSRQSIDEVNIRYSQEGSVLRIWIEHPRNMRFSADGIFDLKVPLNTNVKINNVSGDIIASDLAGKEIALESVSGRISCTNILTNLYAESVSGAVYVQTVKGNLVAKTVSGNLDIRSIAGSLNGSSVSGQVVVNTVNGSSRVSSTSGRLDITNINSRLYANTTSGRISITGVDGDVDCNSVSGSVNLTDVVGALSVKTTSGSISGNNVTITGGTDFDTMSGSITMNLTNANKLSYDLESFSGRLKARGFDTKKNLFIEKENIWVKGKSFSGSQTYM